jgi:hypothetical protein
VSTAGRGETTGAGGGIPEKEEKLGPSAGLVRGTTSGDSARAAARVIAALRAYAAAVGEWQAALADDELRADAALGAGSLHSVRGDGSRDVFSRGGAAAPAGRRAGAGSHLHRTMSVGVMAQYGGVAVKGIEADS